MGDSTIIPSVFTTNGVSCINLVLPSFSFTVDASNAVFPTYSPSLSQGVNVLIHASASTLNNAFQIFTTDTDLLQTVSSEDLQFRYVEQTGNYAPYTNLFDTFANSVADINLTGSSVIYVPPSQSLLDPNADRKTMGDEYISYIAYALFNNTQGLDLLTNVKTVSDDLNTKADDTLINDRLKPLLTGADNGGNVYSSSQQVNDSSHPAEAILTQIENMQPQRLQTITPIGGTGNENWYKNFLISGDIISFDITVYVPIGQNLTNNQSQTNLALSANTGNASASGIDLRLYTINVLLTE